MTDIAALPKTSQPYGKAFLWGGTLLLVLSAGLSLTYGNFSAEGFGRLLALSATSSFLAGFLAKRSNTPWSFWKIGGVFLLMAVGCWLLSSYGAAQGGLKSS
jgi:hypothetical protein